MIQKLKYLLLVNILSITYLVAYDSTYNSSMVSIDINNDGDMDVVLGYGDMSENRGTIRVVYGKYNSEILSYSSLKYINQKDDDVRGAPEKGDHFGAALAAGDFNNDGYGDIAIGIPGESLYDNSNYHEKAAAAGAITIIYGTSDGLSVRTSPWTNDDGEINLAVQWMDQDTKGVPSAVEAFDGFGSVLSSGDYNNDGYADLAIGIPNESIGNVRGAGGITILYGSNQGINPTKSQWFDQNSKDVPGGAEIDDQFGQVLISDDFNNDGFTDLAIGIPNESIGNVRQAGGITILHGSINGLESKNAKWFNQGTRGVPGAAEAYDGFGSALSSGDFNNDGFTDLAIGIPKEDIDGKEDKGGVTILYGSKNNITSKKSQWINDKVDGNEFGSTLCCGDFSRDGISDLAIGKPFIYESSLEEDGSITLVQGTSTGLLNKSKRVIQYLPSEEWSPAWGKRTNINMLANNVPGYSYKNLMFTAMNFKDVRHISFDGYIEAEDRINELEYNYQSNQIRKMNIHY